MAQSPLLLRRLLRAKDKMDAAPHAEWPIHQLAQVSAVSVAYFAREFKKAFGLPPHRYLLTRRIERATALLRDTDQSITEIALQTGWTSLGTFGRIFRDITGASPGQLRVRERSVPPVGEHIPECVMRNAQRPNLNIAVLEKRRIKATGKL
jgi:AraC-like DNA-binding protein